MKIKTNVAVLFLALVAAGALAEDGSAVYPTEGGNLTVTYGQPAPRDYGPRPEFGALDSDDSGSIDVSEARTYGLLDVDFDHADQNGNGGVSSREYAIWPRNR